MALLFVVFAMAMGTGTFIEHWYNTDTARKLIYNAWWFEGIMLLLVLNFVGNIRRYNLYRKEKWSVLLLHLAFILIIFGAFWTRYIGYEGTMSIREGSAANQVLSKGAYITATVEGRSDNKIKRLTIEKPLLLSPLADNHFSIDDELNGEPFHIILDQYIMNGQQVIKEDSTGSLFLKMVVSSDQVSGEYFLKEGELLFIHGALFSFNHVTKGAINITKVGSDYIIESPKEGTFTRMADGLQKPLDKEKAEELRTKWLYKIEGIQFVVPQLAKRGYLAHESNGDFKDEGTDDILKLKVFSGDTIKEVTLIGDKGKRGDPKKFTSGNLKFTLAYGSKVYSLPFSIRLNDFIAEKYPGTESSYSSFESKVTVEDEGNDFATRIYMNNVLDYEGYRFFQASFHPDEKGTILSVNHDFWGTWITYTGYFFLYMGLIAILFDKNSRFGRVRRKLRNHLNGKATFLFLLATVLYATNVNGQPKGGFQNEKDSSTYSINIKKNHAAKFGRLVIQDGKGRMKPINTFSSELLRRVYNEDTYKGFTSDQVFLSMVKDPQMWYNIPIIKIEKGNKRLKKLLKIPLDSEYIALEDLFDEDNRYKLSVLLGDAHRATIPSQFQKDVIELDRKASLLDFALSGEMLKIFPIPNHQNHKWVTNAKFNDAEITGNEALFTKNILPLYLSALSDASRSDDYSQANLLLKKIESYQLQYGKSVRPDEHLITAEILYNKVNIFERLFIWYLLCGLFLIVVGLIKTIIQPGGNFIKVISKLSFFFITILFALHTLGLVFRWYISGHAPWSDAYESMVYVGWATMLFGSYFGRKSELTLGATAFMASIILMVAHWNWMNPAISNLEPVLNSYWLMIHVAIIVASYGPFTLGMVLGVLSLFFMALATPSNKEKIKAGIIETQYIIELSLTVGLVMLTIGNFLGGQWANESWGRYWGWDPKETWALISIIVYAFVIHMRIVPKLRGAWLFGLMSVLAYYSIMMTYFGVNFYLTGLHSYASGDKVVTPDFVYYSLAVLFVLATVAYVKYRRYLMKKPGVLTNGSQQNFLK